MIYFLILVILALNANILIADDCVKSADILSQILVQQNGRQMPESADGPLEVVFNFSITSMSTVPHTNQLFMDVHVFKEWKDSSLYFSHLQPCKPILFIDLNQHSNLWIPDISFTNGEDVVYYKQGTTLQLTQEGVLTHIQRVKFKIPCQTEVSHYPFGNTTCTLSWTNNQKTQDILRMKWNAKDTNQSSVMEVGDLHLLSIEYISVDMFMPDGWHDELNALFKFQRGHHKVILLFFIPSIIFIVVSWLSLALGPMAITRSLLIIGSLLLLLLHYYTNMAGLPETTGITALDLWKIFSLLFVLAILIELVMVTCMASAGRSRRWARCCRRSRKKGKYELEPLYEELNDLRARKTRRTCGCCRYSALLLDFFSLILFAAIFVLFALCFYFKSATIVKYANEFNVDVLKVV